MLFCVFFLLEGSGKTTKYSYGYHLNLSPATFFKKKCKKTWLRVEKKQTFPLLQLQKKANGFPDRCDQNLSNPMGGNFSLNRSSQGYTKAPIPTWGSGRKGRQNLRKFQDVRKNSTNLLSRKLTYPTLGKGKSSSKLPWEGICFFPSSKISCKLDIRKKKSQQKLGMPGPLETPGPPHPAKPLIHPLIKGKMRHDRT